MTASHFIYEKIADDLRSRIGGNEFKNNKLPPERVLAEHYNANRITLRKAITLLEQEKLIFRDGTRGTFIGRAKPRKTGNFVIGLILAGRSRLDQMHSVTIMELERQLKRHNSNMMLFTVAENEKVEDVLTGPVNNGMLDAVIVAGLVSPVMAESIAKMNLPALLFGHLMYCSPVEKAFDRVYPDSVEYSYQAVKYLAKKKYKKIALINGPGYQRFLNIYQGYMRALDEFGITYDESMVEKCNSDTPIEGMNAINKILDREKPEAIFAADERLSLGAIEGLKSRGIDDIEIITVGTDRSELPGREKIKTVAIDWERMVEYALEIIFARINDDDQPPVSQPVPFRITGI